MDLALRILRQGALDGAPAPLVIVEESSDVLGGAAVFGLAVAELARCVGEGRSQAQGLTAVALELSPALYQLPQRQLPPGVLTLLDCAADPHGWVTLAVAAAAAGAARREVLSGVLSGATGLASLELRLAGGSGGGLSSSSSSRSGGGVSPPQAITLDSFDLLVDSGGAGAAVQAVRRLQRSPAVSCLLLRLRPGLHPETTAAALRSLSTGVIRLEAVPPLQAEVSRAADGQRRRPHGWLEAHMLRSTGRVQVKQQMYHCDPLGRVEFLDQAAVEARPEAAAAAEAAVASAVRPAPEAPAAAAVASLAPQLAGGMVLSRTAAEESARARVSLPYEHQGQGARYDPESDFRQYLPPAAGGSAGGGRRLGHILYVRDSGSEADSDEDPDDDLDL